MKKVKKTHMGYDLTDEKQKMALATKIATDVEAGKTLADAMQVPAQSLENLYALAYQKYHHGLYQDAVDLFRYLLMMDHEKYEYALGIAASLQRLGQYESAASTYLYCAALNPEDPVPFYHGAECMMNIGLHEMAMHGYRNTVTAAAGREEYQDLVERAEEKIKKLDSSK